MKNLFKKIIICLSIALVLNVFQSCSSAKYRTSAGVNMTWGPHGPKVRPNINFDIYNGGHFRK